MKNFCHEAWTEMKKQQDDNMQGMARGANCYICGRSGHWAKACPFREDEEKK